MKGRFVAAALAAALVMGLGWAAKAQNVTPESLGSSGLIMTGAGEDARRAIGIGFFVEVPSQSFKGRSFIYLVTARHVLLDGSGRPLHRLSFVIGHGKGGAPVISPLPSANEWFFDPQRPLRGPGGGAVFAHRRRLHDRPDQPRPGRLGCRKTWAPMLTTSSLLSEEGAVDADHDRPFRPRFGRRLRWRPRVARRGQRSGCASWKD